MPNNKNDEEQVEWTEADDLEFAKDFPDFAINEGDWDAAEVLMPMQVREAMHAEREAYADLLEREYAGTDAEELEEEYAGYSEFDEEEIDGRPLPLLPPGVIIKRS